MRDPMQHTYKLGQVVRILPTLMPRGLRTVHKGLKQDLFEVVRLMPEADWHLQYRVKCKATGQERLVNETEILLCD